MIIQNKQKIILILTVIAFLFLGYQVYELISDDTDFTANSLKKPQAKVAIVHQPAKRVNDAAPLIPSQASTTNSANQIVKANLDKKQNTPPMGEANNRLSQLRESLLEQYEIAKMKRQLLQEQASIASSENRIARLQQETRKITSTSADVTDNSNSVIVAPSGNKGSLYQLAYVGKTDGKWDATINTGGNYLTVQVGSELPDGTKVIAISNKGITLQNRLRRVLVNFSGTVNLSAPLPKRMNNIDELTKKAFKAKALAQGKKKVSSTRAKELTLKHINKSSQVRVVAQKAKKIKQPVFTLKTNSEVNNLSTLPQEFSQKLQKIKVSLNNLISSGKPVKNQSQTTLLLSNRQPRQLKLQQNAVALDESPKKQAVSKKRLEKQVEKLLQFGGKPFSITDKPNVKQKPMLSISAVNAVTTNNQGVAQPLASLHLAQPKKSPLKIFVQSIPEAENKVLNLDMAKGVSRIAVSRSSGAKNVWLSEDEKALLKIPNEHYLIQLVGSYHLNDLRNFVQQHHIASQAHEFYVMNNHQRWYTLMYGNFESHAAARRALNHLPAGLKQYGAWVRKGSDVHQAIKTRQ